jgi:hypothetical protein
MPVSSPPTCRCRHGASRRAQHENRRQFADQLRRARATNPRSLLLRTMDEMRQVATGEAQQPPSWFAHPFDPDLQRRLTSTDVVTDDSVEDVKPVKPAKRTRKRKPTLQVSRGRRRRQAFQLPVTRSGQMARSKSSIQRKDITDALAGKTPIMQKVWMKALRHLTWLRGVSTQPYMRTFVSSVTATLCPSLFEVRYS